VVSCCCLYSSAPCLRAAAFCCCLFSFLLSHDVHATGPVHIRRVSASACPACLPDTPRGHMRRLPESGCRAVPVRLYGELRISAGLSSVCRWLRKNISERHAALLYTDKTTCTARVWLAAADADCVRYRTEGWDHWAESGFTAEITVC
jgi:hypothetical protein